MRIFIVLLVLPLVYSCDLRPKTPADYSQSIDHWKSERLKALTAKDGYVNLAGLFWLREGANTFGSSEDNDITFPEGKSPDFMGHFKLANDSVWQDPSGSDILLGGGVVSDIVLAAPEGDQPMEFSYGSLLWVVIKRGDQYGVRLRDLEHPNLSAMDPIEYYPLDPTYRILADYEPYDPPKMVKTTNVLGMTYDAKVPGYLTFNLKGKQYRLEPNIDGDQLHIRFKDKTTGSETYGLGRYLKAEMPAGRSKVVVDFNKSYNPPCAFTEFATCPLPPKENYLDLKVEAGEKNYGDHD